MGLGTCMITEKKKRLTLKTLKRVLKVHSYIVNGRVTVTHTHELKNICQEIEPPSSQPIIRDVSDFRH